MSGNFSAVLVKFQCSFPWPRAEGEARSSEAIYGVFSLLATLRRFPFIAKTGSFLSVWLSFLGHILASHLTSVLSTFAPQTDSQTDKPLRSTLGCPFGCLSQGFLTCILSTSEEPKVDLSGETKPLRSTLGCPFGCLSGAYSRSQKFCLTSEIYFRLLRDLL